MTVLKLKINVLGMQLSIIYETVVEYVFVGHELALNRARGEHEHMLRICQKFKQSSWREQIVFVCY